MDINIERHLVVNKLQSSRVFSGLHRVQVEFIPGKNWITAEELKFLQKNSGGFQHYLKKKDLTLENEVRDETPKEKSLRLKLLEKGQSLIDKIKPKNKETAPGLKTEEELETFQQSLKDESEKELKIFQESFESSLKEIADALTQNRTDKSNEHLKKFTESMNGIVERYKKTLDQVFQDHEKRMKRSGELFFKNFNSSLDKVINNKTSTFTKKLETAALKIKQNAKL